MIMFGNFLRAKREAKGMTLQQVSTALGATNRQNFWNSEMGKNYASSATLKTVAELLGVSFEELVIRKYLDRIGRDIPSMTEEKLNMALTILLSV